MSRRGRVEVAQNFERNLEDIEAWLTEHEAASAFATLLDELFERVVPNLERFPELGADFLARRAGSVVGSARIARLQARLGAGTSLRELIVGDYLVLYAVRDVQRWLLAIRHHRQLSYDLRVHWVR
jgi:plasmid stabilization system protein ParE